MHYGNLSIDVPTENTRIEFRTSGSFTCYAAKAGEYTRVLGPDSSDVRVWAVNVPRGTTEVCIHAAKNTAVDYTMSLLPNRQETPDPTPIELPIGTEKPETLEEMMLRMVEAKFSQLAHEEGKETFEEADDFDVSDEEEWRSPYELTELDPEEPFYPEVSNEPPPLETKPPENTPPEVEGTPPTNH